MNTTQKLIIPVALLVAVVLSLSVWNALRDQQLIRSIEDRCWVAGGEYRNGSCEKPGEPYQRSSEEKVCTAMKGTFLVTKRKGLPGVEFTCYSWQGKELKMPDLKDKEVIVMHDGTVVLRDTRK